MLYGVRWLSFSVAREWLPEREMSSFLSHSFRYPSRVFVGDTYTCFAVRARADCSLAVLEGRGVRLGLYLRFYEAGVE